MIYLGYLVVGGLLGVMATPTTVLLAEGRIAAVNPSAQSGQGLEQFVV